MILRFLLSPWIFYFLAILGLILAIILVMKGKKQLITAKVLENGKEDTDYVYDLICAEFPGACILKEVPIASVGTGSIQITQTVDILYVSRGGIVIITVINGSGAYDNPKTGPWRYRYATANGKTVTVSLPNPFDATIPAANILEGLLAGEKIFLDVKRIAVFTGATLGMTTRYPEAMSVSDLIPYLTVLNQQSVMNGPQFRTASEVIPTFAGYNQQKILTSKYGANTSIAREEPKTSEPSTSTEDPLVTDLAIVPEPTSEALLSQDDETVKLLREVELEIDKEETQNNK